MAKDLKAAVAQLAGKTVMVVGDVMLDEYISGRAVRMSREAPVPVLELESTRRIPGGSANPAANIVSLGGRAIQIAVVGVDSSGEALRDLLRAGGIDASGILSCAQRTTTVKTRILALMGLRFPQQLARIDTIARHDIDAQTESQLIDAISRGINSVDAVLLSHYHGGLLTASLVARIRALCRRHDVLLTADAQGQFDIFSQLDLIKCNAEDAARHLQRDLRDDDDFAWAARQLYERLKIRRAAIITRGSQGATVASADAIHHCHAARVSDVYDTVGAGDTAIAVLTLALAARLDVLEAAALANHASGIVVRHLGNYAPTAAELLRSIDQDDL